MGGANRHPRTAAAVTWVIAPWHSHGRARSTADQIGHPIVVGATGRRTRGRLVSRKPELKPAITGDELIAECKSGWLII